MVDSMLCCDALTLAARVSTVVVMSNDLDVLPAVALAASTRGARTVLVRGVAGPSAYGTELDSLGVVAADWALAA